MVVLLLLLIDYKDCSELFISMLNSKDSLVTENAEESMKEKHRQVS
jgi:hypothetical protein